MSKIIGEEEYKFRQFFGEIRDAFKNRPVVAYALLIGLVVLMAGAVNKRASFLALYDGDGVLTLEETVQQTDEYSSQLTGTLVLQAESLIGYLDDGSNVDGVKAGDTVSVSSGRKRSDGQVTLSESQDADQGIVVGGLDDGEQLNYTFTVPREATYDVIARVARVADGKHENAYFQVKIDGDNVSGKVAVPDTGDWDNWITIDVARVNLTAGSHKLELKMIRNKGGKDLLDINWFQFVPLNDEPLPPEDVPTDPEPTPNPTPLPTPDPEPVPTPEEPTAFYIEAEDYGRDGEGNSYHDTTPGNTGGEYRSDDVDIELARDTGSGYSLGWVDNDEWVKYDFTTATDGTYTLLARVARLDYDGTDLTHFNMYVDGRQVGDTVNVADTGDWHNWVNIEVGNISLGAGQHLLEMKSVDNMTMWSYNVNWYKFVPEGQDWDVPDNTVPDQDPTPPAPDPEPVNASPVLIEAEDYGNNGQNVSYYDLTPGNEGGEHRTDDVDIEGANDVNGNFNVGWIDHDEWLKYDFNIEAEGTYTLLARIARLQHDDIATTHFAMYVDGNMVGSTMNVQDTGGWHTWVTMEVGDVILTTGQHTLEYKAINNDTLGLMNANWFKLVPLGDDWNVPPDTPPPEPIPEPVPDPAVASPFYIEAEDYNQGGEGVAYHDTTAGNTGGEYRTDDVDIELAVDTANGDYSIGWIANDEWLNYDFNIEAEGTYTLLARIARLQHDDIATTHFAMYVDGNMVGSTMDVPDTHDWHNWITMEIGDVNLSAGQHTLQMKTLDNSNNWLFNVNWYKFVPLGQDANVPPDTPVDPEPTPTPEPEPTPEPVNASAFYIEAEDYGQGGEGVSYHDTTDGNSGGVYRNDNVDIESTTDANGGHNIGWVSNNEWLRYDFNVDAAGTYTLLARIARLQQDSVATTHFRMYVDGNEIGNRADVPDLYGWQNWVTMEIGNVNLSTGQHTLEFRSLDNDSTDGVFNMNWYKLVPLGQDWNVPPDSSVTSPTPEPTPTPEPDPTPTPEPTPTPIPEPSGVVGPRTVTCSGVTINPGESIQNKVNSYSNGTTFCLNPGTYYNQQVTPKDNQTFIGLLGAKLDGGGSSSYAFRGSSSGVTVKNLEITNYNNPQQKGAVNSSGGNWTIIYNNFNYNWGVGIKADGNNNKVIDNLVHHNHQLGLGSSDGGNPTPPNNNLFEGNEVSYNNYLDEFEWGWEAGGSKFWNQDNAVIRGNYFHHNHGPGIWSDYNNDNILYEDNLSEYNTGPGIFHEISYSATIRNNTVRNNNVDNPVWLWGAGILIAASQDVEVYGNTVTGNGNGISLVQQDRSASGGQYNEKYGAWIVRNNTVHDNYVSGGASGAVQDTGSNQIFNDNNVWYDNTYGDQRFAWNNSWISLSTWKNYFPNDGI